MPNRVAHALQVVVQLIALTPKMYMGNEKFKETCDVPINNLIKEQAKHTSKRKNVAPPRVQLHGLEDFVVVSVSNTTYP